MTEACTVAQVSTRTPCSVRAPCVSDTPRTEYIRVGTKVTRALRPWSKFCAALWLTHSAAPQFEQNTKPLLMEISSKSLGFRKCWPRCLNLNAINASQSQGTWEAVLNVCLHISHVRDPKCTYSIAVGVFGFDSILLTQGNILDSCYSRSKFAYREAGGWLSSRGAHPDWSSRHEECRPPLLHARPALPLKLRRHTLSIYFDCSVNIFAIAIIIFGRCPVTTRRARTTASGYGKCA